MKNTWLTSFSSLDACSCPLLQPHILSIVPSRVAHVRMLREPSQTPPSRIWKIRGSTFQTCILFCTERSYTWISPPRTQKPYYRSSPVEFQTTVDGWAADSDDWSLAIQHHIIIDWFIILLSSTPLTAFIPCLLLFHLSLGKSLRDQRPDDSFFYMRISALMLTWYDLEQLFFLLLLSIQTTKFPFVPPDTLLVDKKFPFGPPPAGIISLHLFL